MNITVFQSRLLDPLSLEIALKAFSAERRTEQFTDTEKQKTRESR